MNQRVAVAISAIKEVAPDYWAKTLSSRLATGTGSRTRFTDPEGLEKALLEANWEEYSHEALTPGTIAYKADIPGTVGVVELSDLPGDVRVDLYDPKGTGKLQAHVSSDDVGLQAGVDFTVIILGNEDGREVCFTFHPGAPVRPSQVAGEPSSVSAEQAVAMGFITAKVV